MSKLKTTIENLASRLAASKSGRITPNDLLPFLPVSLGIAEEHLGEMVDGTVVLETEVDGFQTFEFPEFLGHSAAPLSQGDCFACRADLSPAHAGLLCSTCEQTLHGELRELAETTAWPARGVTDHELVYITSSAKGPIRVASVAGRSRMTLRKIKEELKKLALAHQARAVMNEQHGVLTYELPPVDYPKDAFSRNDRFIRSHPSSLKDEIELKLFRWLSILAIIIVAAFVLGFFHIPRPILIVGIVLGAAISGAVVFGRRHRVVPEPL